MSKSFPAEIFHLQKSIEEKAKQHGLDFYRSIYEILDYDQISMLASYGGFPVRYPHWRWGMEYDQIKKSYEYGLSKIYEMVINNDPCYAYLLESNSLIEQKLVMCHVTGHNDFFKNNFVFSHTNRKMMNQMANHAARIRKYMDWYGVNEVEAFIDLALSIENLIDINSPYITRSKGNNNQEDEKESYDAKIGRLPANKEYMDKYVNPEKIIIEERKKIIEAEKNQTIFPLIPEQDVLGFLIENAPIKLWQKDILSIIRDEAYYFAPQGMTKIMNEGWASYWHVKLMSEHIMLPSELIDFADKHSMVTQINNKALNPYKLGLELYRDIEDRWNKGQFGPEWDNCDSLFEKQKWQKDLNLGKEKIFQARKIYNDLTFIDEFLTLDFCKKHGLFTYNFDKRKQEYVIESRDFLTIKQKLLNNLTNLGNPIIKVTNGNYENRMELLLEHVHSGVDLDFTFAKATLKNISLIWTRPVHLLTKFEDRNIHISHDGENYKENVFA